MPSPRSVELRRHPGERWPVREVILAQGGCCCCCCCCCLHSLGSLIGGIAGTRSPLDRVAEGAEVPPEAPPTLPGDSLMCRMYWWLVLATTIVASLTFAYYQVNTIPNAILWGLLIVVVGAMPVVQLVGSMLALFAMPFLPVDQQDTAHRRLGRITWWSLLGMLIGIGVMIPIGGLVLLTCNR
jgi:hypothetical protein